MIAGQASYNPRTSFAKGLCCFKNRRYCHFFILDIGKNVAVHFAHQGAADIKSQAAAAVAARIGAAPEAVEDMRQLVFAECAAAVADVDELTIVLP